MWLDAGGRIQPTREDATPHLAFPVLAIGLKKLWRTPGGQSLAGG